MNEWSSTFIAAVWVCGGGWGGWRAHKAHNYPTRDEDLYLESHLSLWFRHYGKMEKMDHGFC